MSIDNEIFPFHHTKQFSYQNKLWPKTSATPYPSDSTITTLYTHRYRAATLSWNNRLQQPMHPIIDPTQYYLGQDLITFALHMMHMLSLYKSTRHYLPPTFIQIPQANYSRDTHIHRRYLSHFERISLDHEFISILTNITRKYCTVLIWDN